MSFESGTGAFITFEGGEGSGKSTQINRLAKSLRDEGWEVVTARAPGGTQIGETIRSIVLNDQEEGLAPRAETLLFLADMSHLTDSVIRPGLDRGAVVLCDRYFDSTIAYQGFARGHGRHEIARIARWATSGLVPDLTFLLDVPPEVGLARKSADEWNRMEGAGQRFHEQVREGMLRLASEDPYRFRVVDAEQSPDQVFAEVLGSVARLASEITLQTTSNR